MSFSESAQPWNKPPAVPPEDKAKKPLPEISKPAPTAAGSRIRYLTAFRFPFVREDWLRNLLLFSLCLLIPVLNQLVLFGYTYEAVELLHRGSTDRYPKFDFQRFAEYVTRGVWAFLIFFITNTLVMFVYQVVFQILFQGTMFGVMASQGEGRELATIIAAIVISVVVSGFILFVLGVCLVVRPLMLRAGLSQDFAQAVKFPWLGHYLKRMWLETFLVNLFTILVFALLFVPSLALCCFGPVILSGFIGIMGAHFDYQLYELYLARGGEPIPLKPLPAEVPPVVTGH